MFSGGMYPPSFLPQVTTMAPTVKGRDSDAGLVEIWIVDDDDSFRDALVTFVNQAGEFSCKRDFPSCEEALRVLTPESAPPVILLDIDLPGGMNGIEGTARVKNISPTTEVIMLTASGEDEKIFDAFCSGASGYLSKISSGEEIVEGIRYVLDGGRPMNAIIARKVIKKFVELAKPSQEEYNLTAREREILDLLKAGLSKKQIAAKLFLSHFTVETHVKNIYAKLQAHTLGELLSKVLPRPLR
jgi:DNA-binding NarL/FixJ family response regulator